MGDVVCISNEAARRARAALDCVYALVPDATPKRKELLAGEILSMCFDERHGFMHEVTKVVEPATQRLYCRAGGCPLIAWWSRLVRTVRMLCGEKG